MTPEPELDTLPMLPNGSMSKNQNELRLTASDSVFMNTTEGREIFEAPTKLISPLCAF